MRDYSVYLGDCLDGLRQLPDGAARTCVTSPPYFGLRDYGHEGQIGLEPTPDEFVAALVRVFREVRRVLADDGTAWLNLGDSYASTGGDLNKRKAGASNTGQQRVIDANANKGGSRTPPDGLKSKDLLGIPWRVAFALQADGWYLRQDIIWHKPNPMPESVRDRCTKSHEYIFLLSKSPRYYFDSGAISERSIYSGITGMDGSGFKPPQDFNGKHSGGSATLPERRRVDGEDGGKRNRRSVWTVATRPFSGAHFAVFPPDLIEPCVLAGSAPGDLVIDPFTGSGTTGVVAGKHGRKFYGCELNPEYAEMANESIAASYSQGRLFA